MPRREQELLIGGYEPADCQSYTCPQVAAAERDLKEHQLSREPAWSDDAVKLHLEKARQGAVFLLVYAPNDVDTRRP